MIGEIDIQEDESVLARHVANWLTEVALAASDPIRIALAGGSTPEGLYSTLASGSFRDRFPWNRVFWFWGDERFVPHDHPSSNCGMVRRVMLEKVQLPERNVHPISVDGSPGEAARRYEQLLREVYGSALLDPARPLFDVTLLGLGTDGHTASLFPGEPALEERRRWVVALPQRRPEARITLTYPALESSRRVAFLVAGAKKAAIFAAIRAGGSEAPAARLRPGGPVVWFVDRAAAGAL